MFVKDYLRPAAIKAGVELQKGQRFGLHNFRHTLATWLVCVDGTDVKTAQAILRHANPRILLAHYTKAKDEQVQAALGRYLEACGLGVGWSLSAPTPVIN
jgi:integrase